MIEWRMVKVGTLPSLKAQSFFRANRFSAEASLDFRRKKQRTLSGSVRFDSWNKDTACEREKPQSPFLHARQSENCHRSPKVLLREENFLQGGFSLSLPRPYHSYRGIRWYGR